METTILFNYEIDVFTRMVCGLCTDTDDIGPTHARERNVKK